MEDAVYDQLYRELQQLETQYPELIADSPLSVGEKPATHFLSTTQNSCTAWRMLSTLRNCKLGSSVGSGWCH